MMWNEFIILKEVNKFPKFDFSNSQFGKWLHNATFYIMYFLKKCLLFIFHLFSKTLFFIALLFL
jgi:hypothetical protein